MPSVRSERSEWRDLDFSKRHRKFGWDCPAVDIDFLMVEYDCAKPIALIEYKHEFAKQADPHHTSYLALGRLASSARIPFFAIRYASNYAWYLIIPLNRIALTKFPQRQKVDEQNFIRFLYQLRGRTLNQESWEKISAELQKNGDEE